MVHLAVRKYRRKPENYLMMHTIVPLVLFLFPLAFSPGPGNLFFAANGARFGFWSTMPLSLGYHIATWVVTVAIGFGFSAALELYPKLFQALKIAGSIYVFWLAWKFLMAGVLERIETAKPASFNDGVVLLILNPKAYVIVSLMFTQFLGESNETNPLMVILIATVFTANNFVAFSIWTVVGSKLAQSFRSDSEAITLNTLFGTLLGGVGLWILLS